jgi:hypothetical protein
MNPKAQGSRAMSDETRFLAWNRRLVLQAAVFAGISVAIGSAKAAEAVGTIADLRGEAAAEQAKKRRKLRVKSPVELTDILTTAKQSRLTARLGDKTTLRMGAETRVKIDNFIVDAGGELTLGSGALLLDAPMDGFPKGLAVESPFALIAVRGTRFFAGKIDGVFGVFVERGSVNVTAGGRTVRLRRGQGIDIPRRGGPPGPIKTWGQPKIRKALALVR